MHRADLDGNSLLVHHTRKDHRGTAVLAAVLVGRGHVEFLFEVPLSL